MDIQIDLKRGDFEAMHPTAKTFNFDAVKMTYIGNCADVKRLNELWSTWCACIGLVYLEASVPEGFALFDGEELTYSNGYSVKCEFDEQFDCPIFDVYKDGDCIKDGMTQMAQAHHLVVSMIQVEAQEDAELNAIADSRQNQKRIRVNLEDL